MTEQPLNLSTTSLETIATHLDTAVSGLTDVLAVVDKIPFLPPSLKGPLEEALNLLTFAKTVLDKAKG